MSWIPSYKKKYEPEPYVPCSWSTGTDEEIVEALQMHYAGRCDLHDYWAVGDERTISLNAMAAYSPLTDTHIAQNRVFVLSNVGGKYLSDGVTECCFQVDQKKILNTSGKINSTDTTSGSWKSSARRAWCNEIYYNAIPSTIRGIFKEFINQTCMGLTSTKIENTTDYFALRAEVEIFGSVTNSATGEGSQVTWYTDSINRVKKTTTKASWWERSPVKNSTYPDYNSTMFCAVYGNKNDNTANTSYYVASSSIGLAPFGVI